MELKENIIINLVVMNNMKIIDLLNKIANEQEVPKKIKYQNYIYEYQHRRDTESSFNYMCNENGEYLSRGYFIDNILNDEVEIIEKEEKMPKKLPKKLPYYSIERIQKAKNEDEWREERISLLEKRVDDMHIKINDLLDYLKSKGE